MRTDRSIRCDLERHVDRVIVRHFYFRHLDPRFVEHDLRGVDQVSALQGRPCSVPRCPPRGIEPERSAPRRKPRRTKPGPYTSNHRESIRTSHRVRASQSHETNENRDNPVAIPFAPPAASLPAVLIDRRENGRHGPVSRAPCSHSAWVVLLACPAESYPYKVTSTTPTFP